MKKSINRRTLESFIMFTLLANIVLLVFSFCCFIQTHFLWNTSINGISCSFLTIDSAAQRITSAKGKENITLSFIDGQTYSINLKELEFNVDKAIIEQIFQQNHKSLQSHYKYNVDGLFTVDMEYITELLKSIPSLQNEHMAAPQDAYILWNGIDFEIQEGFSGNLIDFEEALDLVTCKIKNGENFIDFSSITTIQPNITTEDLSNERDWLNKILKSSINYELIDGSIVTLDSNIIKNWIYLDENGNFKYDIENGVRQFVESLAIKVNESNSAMHFNASDFEGDVIINIPQNLRVQLDMEKEILNIKSLLGNSTPIYCKPIYDRISLPDMLISYVELDISRQHIWFYLNGELLLDTSCVTGNPMYGYDTPQGVFFLLNKDREALLEGNNADGSKYSTKVEYWMRFYQGYGFHDAWWRTTFGGEIYKTNGSHGCVNMPSEIAAKMFEFIDSTMPIIIYQS